MIADAAKLLPQTFRDADIIARLGGDEFVVLIPACSDNSDEFYSRLQVNIDRFNQAAATVENPPYQISMSAGIQFRGETDEMSLEHLLVQADKLMYEHKYTKRSQ